MLPAKNGAGEKRRRRKIGAGEKICRRNSRRKMLPAKFAATNARRQNCRGILFRWETNFEVAKFRVIFGGPIAHVVVGGEKRAEFFSPPETLCLQAQNSTAKSTTNFTTQICLGHALSAISGFEHIVSASPFTHSRKSGTCRSCHDKCPLRANQLLMLFVQIVAMSGCWPVSWAMTYLVNCSFFFKEVPYGKSMRHQRHVKIRGQTVTTFSHQNPQWNHFADLPLRMRHDAWKRGLETMSLHNRFAQKWPKKGQFFFHRGLLPNGSPKHLPKNVRSKADLGP